jgi:hypothetical protein
MRPQIWGDDEGGDLRKVVPAGSFITEVKHEQKGVTDDHIG